MVRRPLYDPQNSNMTGYPSPGGPPPSGYPGGEPAQRYGDRWQAYPPPQSYSPYGSQAHPAASPPQGNAYGPPPPGAYYGHQQPQVNQYPTPGYGQNPQYQAQSYYGTPPPQYPYQPAAQPPYPPQSPPVTGYPPSPQIKSEYGATSQSGPLPPPGGQFPQTEEERGLLGALAGGAAGGAAGHKMGHGFLGTLAGALAGHKLEDAYKDHKKTSRPSSSRRSSSSSSSSDDSHRHSHKHHHDHHNHNNDHHQAPPPPRGNFAASSERISLDHDHDLIAECASVNGSRRLSSIALNRLLTNDDGHFRWAREGNFGASARNVRLVEGGRWLEAELCSCNGSWRWDRVCLDDRIENSDGNLVMLW